MKAIRAVPEVNVLTNYSNLDLDLKIRKVTGELVQDFPHVYAI